MINQSNYEAFALDYLEGNLSANEQEEMEVFLQNNPLIAVELAEMQELVVLEADKSIVFENKRALLKSEEEAKVVVMHKRTWFRLVVAAAAILFLIGGYFAGYFTERMEGMKPEYVEVEDEKLIEKETHEINIKEEKVIVFEDVMEKNEKKEAPAPQMKEERKAIPQSKPKAVKTYEDVVDNSSEKIINPMPKPNIETPEKEEIQEEESMIVEQENPKQEEATPEITPEIEMPENPKQEKEVIANTLLPEENIEQPNEETIENEEEEIVAITENTTTNSEEVIQKKQSKKRKVLRKIGRFLGDLPFEEVTTSFVPTYYRDSK